MIRPPGKGRILDAEATNAGYEMPKIGLEGGVLNGRPDVQRLHAGAPGSLHPSHTHSRPSPACPSRIALARDFDTKDLENRKEGWLVLM